MNRHEAKRQLEVFRPGGADARDPCFAEALKQLEHDPELARWFNEQRRFDAVMAEGVKAVATPADLKAAILSAT